MICDKCKTDSKKSIYSPIDKLWLCPVCRDPKILKPNMLMDFTKYVQQESAEIVKDRMATGNHKNKYTDRENWRENFRRG